MRCRKIIVASAQLYFTYSICLLTLTIIVSGCSSKLRADSLSDKDTYQVEKIDKYYIKGMLPMNDGQVLTAPSWGSGISVISENDDKIELLTVTDSGPTRRVVDNGKKKKEFRYDVKKFLFPAFDPSLAIVSIEPDGGKVEKIIPILDEQGNSLNGIPREEDAFTQAPVDDSFKKVKRKKRGIDPEAVVYNPLIKSAWVAEEYGPSIVEVDLATGRVKRRLDPGQQLPKELAYKFKGRGFESLSSNGLDKLYAVMQSHLSKEGNSLVPSPDIPFIEYDLTNNTYKVFKYFDENEGKDDLKLGDLAWISEDTFLTVELRQKSEDPQDRTAILVRVSLNSKDGILNRQAILNVNDLGWRYEKLEGIEVLKDRKTVLLAADNDFGFSGIKFSKTNSKDLKSTAKNEVEESDLTPIWKVVLNKPL